MRNRTLLMALVVIVACGAGPFRGGIGRISAPSIPSVAPQVSATTPNQTAGARQVAAAVRQPEIAQVSFSARGAEGLTVQWDTITLGGFDSDPAVVPFVQNFQSTKSYRLKLTNIPGKPDLTLYPTLTIAGVTPRTRAYLDHNSIPVKFTQSDFDQVENGNFVTKVIFLPSQKYQNLALAGGVDTIVNTQLPAGADPIAEALNRGAILAVVQIGNKDLSLEGSTLDGSLTSMVPDPQIPISGVNAPAWGVPAPESQKNMTELPTIPTPDPDTIFTPVRPIPSTSIPPVEPTWSGNL